MKDKNVSNFLTFLGSISKDLNIIHVEATYQKITALLLGGGSILFLIAAFLPYSRVFTESLPEEKLAIIMEMRTLWTVGQILFGTGAALTAIALGFQSYGLREVTGATWSHLGVVLMLAGAVLWCWHLWERTVDPEAFTKGLNTPYLFMLYSFLTQIGLFLIGIMLVKSGTVNWVGWMFIVGSVVFLLLMVIFKDTPPLVYYVLTAIAAVTLFVRAV